MSDNICSVVTPVFPVFVCSFFRVILHLYLIGQLQGWGLGGISAAANIWLEV